MFETRYLTGWAVPCIPALLYGLHMRQVSVMLRQMQDISAVNPLSAATCSTCLTAFCSSTVRTGRTSFLS